MALASGISRMFHVKLLRAFNLSISPLRSLSTLAAAPTRPPKTTLTSEHLVSCHGFSPETAVTLSDLVARRRRPSRRLDPVISLFKSYGFSPASIAAVFLSYPNLLSASPLDNIKPKFDFLSASGLSGDALVHVICNDPFILMRSLDAHLVPCVNCLIKFFGNRDDFVSLFMSKRGSWALRNYSEAMELNINSLRDYGVSNAGIAKLITLRVRALSRTPSEFREILDEIKYMGLDPSSMMFIYGVCSCAGMKRQKWEAKMNLFYGFGFSQSQFKALFVKQPGVMNSSMKRMEKMLNYLMKELGWTVDYITSYPIVLMSSLEKKIIPRLSVFSSLHAEGLVKGTAIGRAVVISEAEFQRFFLGPFLEKHPQILEIYKNNKDSGLLSPQPLAS